MKKKIEIKDQSVERVMTPSGEFRCPHKNTTIEAPCCTAPDSDGNWSCGCQGRPSIYCHDCQNEDMTDEDVEQLLQGVRL